MHTLKNHLPMLSVHIQNAFVSQQSGALAINHGVHELSKSRPMKRAVRAEHETLDIVVIMAMTCVVRLSITCRFKWQVQFAIEVEPSYVEYIPQRDFPKRRHGLRCPWVHPAQAIRKKIDFGLPAPDEPTGTAIQIGRA